MKHCFTLLLAVLASFSYAEAQITETSYEAVGNMGLGWNLGNTLDANNQKVYDVTRDDYWGQQGLESETCWGQVKTTKELITMMKNAGFGAIRVPVTWYNHMDKDGNVNAEWMARVKEVVDYVIDNGMYCIVNVHHDTGADTENSFISWLKADETYYDNNKARYENLWNQIATEFKDYDNHLLFESYNEMLDPLSSWCYASFSAKNQYDATVATSAYNAINKYCQSFVTIVRATGGNNATRNLILNTYCASNGYGTWSSHLNEPLTEMKYPEDSAEKHIIFEVHDYPSIAGVLERSIVDIKGEIDETINNLQTSLCIKGAPVIFGEWGTNGVDNGAGKTDYDLHRSLMLQFAEYFVKKCKDSNIATFYWMGLSDGVYRSYPSFNQPDLAKSLCKAYHGSTDGYVFPDGDPTGITSVAVDKVNANHAIFNIAGQRISTPQRGLYIKDGKVFLAK